MTEDCINAVVCLSLAIAAAGNVKVSMSVGHDHGA